MRILVFGAGAVGQAVGCMLANAGHAVDLVLRERYIERIRAQGLSVSGIFGEYAVPQNGIGAFSSIEDVAGNAYDFALITAKSFDTDGAVEALSSLHQQDFIAVSMQNGCGNIEKVERRFGRDRTLGGRVITGFEIVSPGHVKITVTADAVHIGGTVEGETPLAASVLAEAIDAAGLPCVATARIRRDLFAKLLYNCALNPLGAALGVHYGALGDNPDARAVMNAIIDEVFAVITASGGATHWNSPEDYRAFFYGSQVPATYNHRSSMLQDIERGKRTEVDALTGYVSEAGRACGVPTPVCDTLSSIIRFKERQGMNKR